MAGEHLVCAACSGRVSDGRCPTCRASRHQLHTVPAAALLIALALALLLALVPLVLAIS